MTPEATPPLNFRPESQLHLHCERNAGGVQAQIWRRPTRSMRQSRQGWPEADAAEPRLGSGSRGEEPHRVGKCRCTMVWMSER
jgi:hypothetical protein